MKHVPALELRSVSYSADGKPILKSVDWTVRAGERWAILGPNGAGKTTLLKLAFGYLWPNAGGVIYRRGTARANLPELRKSIGWVTSTLAAQIPEREPVLRTVVSGKFAQIGYVETFGVRASGRDYRAAQRFLEEMGCGYVSNQAFGTLSQGEQQKVLIARARMTRPYVIILDEPCAGMDLGARENFLAGLTVLGRQKKVPALILVTHHVEEILPLFTRTLLLKDGRILEAGKTRDVLTRDALVRLFGIALDVIQKKGRTWVITK
jgi:iron complex transport system ATP-binding protein